MLDAIRRDIKMFLDEHKKSLEKYLNETLNEEYPDSPDYLKRKIKL
jgi:hypothetical protein